MKTRIILTAVMLVATAALVRADQPFMRAARADLQTARRELQRALPDKGGHRVKAIGLVNDAIREVDAGIAFDRRHNHASAEALPELADQPHMQAALDALKSARHNLDNAEADKGGHRAKAIDLIKDAIDEVNKGIEAGQ